MNRYISEKGASSWKRTQEIYCHVLSPKSVSSTHSRLLDHERFKTKDGSLFGNVSRGLRWESRHFKSNIELAIFSIRQSFVLDIDGKTSLTLFETHLFPWARRKMVRTLNPNVSLILPLHSTDTTSRVWLEISTTCSVIILVRSITKSKSIQI